MQCTQYIICLELLTPTDSESLPWGWQSENRKGTRELWQKERKRQKDTERETTSQTGTGWAKWGGGDRQEIKFSEKEWMRLSPNSCTEHAHSPCGLLMWRSREENWWAAPTRASQVSCGGSHAPPPSQLAHYLHQFVLHVCKEAGSDGWMNDRTIEQAARASVQLRLLVVWLSFSASFIQRGAIVEPAFFVSDLLFWKRKHKTSRQVKALTAHKFNITRKDSYLSASSKLNVWL